jgi:hypothetical protein
MKGGGSSEDRGGGVRARGVTAGRGRGRGRAGYRRWTKMRFEVFSEAFEFEVIGSGLFHLLELYCTSTSSKSGQIGEREGSCQQQRSRKETERRRTSNSCRLVKHDTSFCTRPFAVVAAQVIADGWFWRGLIREGRGKGGSCDRRRWVGGVDAESVGAMRADEAVSSAAMI